MSALSAFVSCGCLTRSAETLILQRYVQSRKREQMSALVKPKAVDERRAAFANALARLGAPDKAAIECGYADPRYGYVLARDPSVLALLHVAIQKRLAAGVAVSLNVLERLRDDDATPARVRADISLQLAKMAGHVVPSNKADAPGKQLSEMTQAEMLDYIERNQAEIDRAVDELAARATPVSAQVIAQEPSPTPPKLLEFLD